MSYISVFDMLKIGIGPSSSHTLGPWRAAELFLKELKERDIFYKTDQVKVDLYGSLSLTGVGHATDLAVILGLSGADPEYVPVDNISTITASVKETNLLNLGDEREIYFDPTVSIVFKSDFLPFHSNGILFTAFYGNEKYESTFYSIGGGFIVKENEGASNDLKELKVPFPLKTSNDLITYCNTENKKISEIVRENERITKTDAKIDSELIRVWSTMLESVYIGCHTEGFLPGGLNVRRRSYDMYQKLKGESAYSTHKEWIQSIRKTKVHFRQILKWVSCYALAVNEVNASLGRIVTAPTNGSSGVIPSVLLYYLTIDNHKAGDKEIIQFLTVAGVIGSIFKNGATISAAMGGCQAEIGVSSAMAAAALCELLGGTPDQVLMAAEIAMEHHLGLTCDPVGGLVQIPCIERNAMGAIKAINAAELALESDPKNVKVSLDKVVATMWETSLDMNSKYKETSMGGLAIAVNIPNC